MGVPAREGAGVDPGRDRPRPRGRGPHRGRRLDRQHGLPRRPAAAPLRGVGAVAREARRERHAAVVAGRGAGGGRDRAGCPVGGRTRHPLRPDGGPPPIAQRLPRASGGSVPTGGDPRVLRPRDEAPRSRGPRAPRTPRLRGREALRPPFRGISLARAGTRRGRARRSARALGATGARSPARRAVGAAAGRPPAARPRLGAGRRRQPARPVAVGAPARRLGRDRWPGALGAPARGARARARAPARRGRRGGRAAGGGARAAARRPRAPPRLRAAARRAARRVAGAGDVGRVARSASRTRRGRAAQSRRGTRHLRRARADGAGRSGRPR